jgi:hypothetical protein
VVRFELELLDDFHDRVQPARGLNRELFRLLFVRFDTLSPSSIPHRRYQIENKATRLCELEEPCQRFKRTLHGRAEDGNRFRDRCENREYGNSLFQRHRVLAEIGR